MAFANILVPIDIDDPATAGLVIAKAGLIADTFGSAVQLLYVLPNFPSVRSRYLREELVADIRNEALQEVNSLRRTLALPDDRVTVNLRHGSVSSEIVRAAEEDAIDLIVIGAHQPGIVSRFLGSVANAVVRDAKVNVLIVRHA